MKIVSAPSYLIDKYNRLPGIWLKDLSKIHEHTCDFILYFIESEVDLKDDEIWKRMTSKFRSDKLKQFGLYSI